MKKHLFRSLSFLLVLAAFLPSIVYGRQVVVGIYQNAPLVFMKEDGEVEGIYIDILEFIAKKENWQLEFRLGNWAECLERLDRREIDILPAIALSAGRMERYDFTSEPILTNWGVIYLPLGIEIRSLDDLSEKKIAVVKDDIYYQAFKAQAEKFYISPQFIEVDGFDEVFRALDARRADAGIVSRLFGSYHQHDYEVQATLFSLHPVGIHLAVQKGLNQDLLEAADREITLLKKDKNSVYYRSKNIWLEGVYNLAFPKWLKPEWALVFLFGVISAILVGLVILRKLLRVRTRELHATISAKEKIESELRIAHEIQMESVPRLFPPFPERKELDIFAVLEPARQVGGDFYDFFFLDNEQFCFVIGDVSGKGVPAALFMSAVKTLIKATAKHVQQPGKLLEAVNQELAPENESCTFVTVFCGILNVATGEMRYSNAGHNSPLLLRRNCGAVFVPNTRTTVVGVDEEAVFHEARLAFAPGDSLCLYTDGITEAFNAENAMFTEERLQRTIVSYPADSMQHFVQALLNDVKRFAGETPQFDDMTLLALRYCGSF